MKARVPPKRFLFATGLIGPAARWERFEHNWKIALAHNGVDYFHAAEFYNHSGPWKPDSKWDSQQRCDAFIADLFSIVRASESRPDEAVLSLVWKEAYKRVFPNPDAVKRTVGTAYTVACTGCWWLGGKWAKEHLKSEDIHFFFDKEHEHAGDALAAYTKAKNYAPLRKRHRLGGLTFIDDERCVPLQAANLLAYGVMKNLSSRGNPLDVDPVIRDFTCNLFKHTVLIANESYLQKMRTEHCAPTPRAWR